MAAPYGQMYVAGVGPTIAAAMSNPVVVEASYAEIWSGLDNGNSLLLGSIPVLAGSVTIDRNSQSRRTATNITLSPNSSSTLMPSGLGSAGNFAARGQELKLFKGVTVAGVTTYAQLGVFEIDGVDVLDEGAGITLVGTMSDRSAWISRHTLLAPYAVTGSFNGSFGSNVAVVIADILLAACGTAYTLFGWTSSGNALNFYPTARAFKVGTDVWPEIVSLVQSVGAEIYFDYAGNLQICDVANPGSGSVCVTYAEGNANMASGIKRQQKMQGVPNVICAQSGGSSVLVPMTAWWWESDSAKATFFAAAPVGGFTTYQATLPTGTGFWPTNVKAMQQSCIDDTTGNANQAMALGAGYMASGSFETVELTLRDQPAHDVDDIVSVTRAAIDLSAESVVLDRVVIDLEPDKPTVIAGRPV